MSSKSKNTTVANGSYYIMLFRGRCTYFLKIDVDTNDTIWELEKTEMQMTEFNIRTIFPYT